MNELLDSDTVHAQIDRLLISGRAATAREAEEMFLNEHLDELVELATRLDEETFANHEAVKLLFAHGSRRWEDDLR